ncbi:MAG: Tad domain-containing protein [Pseudomonadota bacterium]
MSFKLPKLFRRDAQAAQRDRRDAKNFLVNDEGTVTIFGLMMFVLMVAAGGIAIDIMRYETQRVQLQYALDRAVLAAASMNQELDPEDVVLDYMARAGLERYRIDVRVDPGANFRRVTATAEMDINTSFMDMFGVRALTSPAAGVAEETILNTEISLVLDVSGSMRGAKIASLRSAGQDFVETVMQANDPGTDEMTVSMSIVPYNGMVNAGSQIASVYSFDSSHSQSTCALFEPYVNEFNAGDFGSTALSPTQPLDRMQRFDYYNQYRWQSFADPYCPEDDFLAIMPWSNDVGDLQTYIGNLPAEGWTAIDAGMRWGVALLDPSAQPALTGLGTAVHEDFAGRPAAYDDRETVKYLILMTDGANTEQYDLRDRFQGNSVLYYYEPDDTYSVYVPQLDEYYITVGDYGISGGYFQDTVYDPNLTDSTVSAQVPWEELWTSHTARRLASELYYWPYYYRGVTDDYWDVYTDSLELLSGDENFPNLNGLPYPPERAQQADANLQAMCDAARAQGIIVFTIAFDAPQRGRDAMRSCVGEMSGPNESGEQFYYNVEGFDIEQAFDSIAATINSLRLIQ